MLVHWHCKGPHILLVLGDLILIIQPIFNIIKQGNSRKMYKDRHLVKNNTNSSFYGKYSQNQIRNKFGVRLFSICIK